MTERITWEQLSLPLKFGIIGGFAYLVVVLVMMVVGIFT